MNATDTKINYFLSKVEQLRTAERNYKTLATEFNQEFGEWLRSQGMPDNFNPVELIAHFRGLDK
jgi:hypothetical protein